jgi:hypothetical protein
MALPLPNDTGKGAQKGVLQTHELMQHPMSLTKGALGSNSYVVERNRNALEILMREYQKRLPMQKEKDWFVFFMRLTFAKANAHGSAWPPLARGRGAATVGGRGVCLPLDTLGFCKSRVRTTSITRSPSRPHRPVISRHQADVSPLRTIVSPSRSHLSTLSLDLSTLGGLVYSKLIEGGRIDSTHMDNT